MAVDNNTISLNDPSGTRKHTTNVDEVLEALRQNSTPHEVDIAGMHLIVLPQVLSPRLSHAPDALISKWHIPRGSRILDLGCGCGVLGIAALRAGGGNLVALDINSHAVENARINLQKLGLSEHAEARLSDVYGALRDHEKFDVIIFAAPYWDRAANDPLELSCFDHEYAFFRAAISGAKARLNSNGRMYIIFSDQGDVSTAARAIHKSGLSIASLHIFRPTSPQGHVRIVWELVAEEISE